MRIVKIICGNCNNSLDIAAGVPANLSCHQCGNQSFYSDVDTERTCLQCGIKEKFKKGKKYPSYHQVKEDSPKHPLVSIMPAPVKGSKQEMGVKEKIEIKLDEDEEDKTPALKRRPTKRAS